MNSKELMVNLMVEKICKYIDAGDINKIVVHGKEFAKVKKGKWIEYKDCEGKSRKITCNQCSHEEWNWLDPNFCSNCGADMRGDY